MMTVGVGKGRLQVVAKVLVTAMALVVACGGLTSCTVYESSVTVGMPRPQDGRDIAFGCMYPNYSQTKPLTLVSVKLIDPVGLELVEASTVSMDAQVGSIGAVPPIPTDGWCEPGSDYDCMANWASRVPLAESVVPPDDVLMIVLVLRPTSDEPCLHASGAMVTYKQGWRQSTEPGCTKMVVRSGDFDSCDHVFDR